MSDNGEKNVLFCPQLKDIQFTVKEEERNQKIFTFKKLESENFDYFSLKSTQLSKYLAINLIVDNKSINCCSSTGV